MTPAVEFDGVTVRYSSAPILKRISLRVPCGVVCALLGPNGAGKTTAIRALLGLTVPSEGSIRLFGEEIRSNRAVLLRRVGCLLDPPPIYPHLTAYENAAVFQKLYDVLVSRIDVVLSLAGLQERQFSAVRTFSQGMKQRLGFAIALLPDPDLLILDEPTNGFDPHGVRTFYEVVARLQKEGKTILLSSHQLDQVERVVSHVVVLRRGEVLLTARSDRCWGLAKRKSV